MNSTIECQNEKQMVFKASSESKICIIIPVYQVQSYLSRCLDSVFKQTLIDYRLVLVDDGSEDFCSVLCDEYLLKDTRVIVVHQKNKGLSAARNTGIDFAFLHLSIKWLAFIDSDDWVAPNFLEFMYRAVLLDNTKICVCEYVETSKNQTMNTPIYKSYIYSWDKLFVSKNTVSSVAWNKLYSKSLFHELRYPVGKLHEDEFLTYKLLIRAGSISYLSSVLYAYFQNPRGITGSDFSIRNLDVLDALKERISYVKKYSNRDIVGFCVCQYFYCFWDRKQKLENSESIPKDLLELEKMKLYKEFRLMLLKYGIRYVPPWRMVHYYDYAFPTINSVARKCIRIVKKIDR